MPMKKLSAILLSCVFLFFSAGQGVNAQELSFKGIRNNQAELEYFFTQMPKGGDLHNHLTGSVYAETYFQFALSKGMYLNTATYRLYPTRASIPSGLKTVVQLSPTMANFLSVYMDCLNAWSVRNFTYLQRNFASDEFFFGSFGLFGGASSALTGDDYKDFVTMMLKELRNRAEAENVLYLEVMLTSPPSVKLEGGNAGLNAELEEAIAKRDEPSFNKLLEQIYSAWEGDEAMQAGIGKYISFITDVHNAAKAAVPGVTSRYLAYASRNKEPLQVFSQLYEGFKATEQSPLIVGVNIVSAENGETSLRDYWGHMRMFAFLKKKMGDVKTSLHAGELTIGLVPPEDLKNHISEAVNVADADRIGHGVDIAFETDAEKTLRTMAQKKVAVEINLTSNEFILGVKGSGHPLMLYHDSGVPIVLSTDDPGILRTNLSEQYALAAMRYPKLTYADFKQFSMNSITYSFLPDDLKQNLLATLEQRFTEFEKDWKF
jgi:adenosine deaminase